MQVSEPRKCFSETAYFSQICCPNFSKISSRYTFIADLALQILAYVAQAERENIKSRQAQGIAAAKSQGVHMGRHPKPVPDNFEKECIAWMNKKKTIRQAAAACGMPPTTFFKKASQFVPNNPAALPTEGF